MLKESIIHSAIDSSFAAISEIEHITSPYDSTSEISVINQKSSGQSELLVSHELALLIKHALEISKATDGSFDFTIWPVFKLWNFNSESSILPSSERIEQNLKLVDFQKVKLDSSIITFTHRGMEIDLGGIVKGYAVEIARKILISYGLETFLIDAGGNLGVECKGDIPVQIFVRHPRIDGEYWCKFKIDKSMGIATSGDYQFYFTYKGKRYHHILNPNTGYPVQNTVSATILAPDAIRADGYSTAVFVMGPDKGSKFVDANRDLEGIIIYPFQNQLNTFVSGGLKNAIEFLGNEKNTQK
jgi:thiamine biosynthesis lipoprotein